jgi:serine/threonine-protein kinase
LALHEYPQALQDLEQAIKFGYKGADAYYALGLCLGLHYKQAKAELRDMGPPSWAKKRLQPLQDRYLTPAIAALARSRQLDRDEPEYLEGLIAFYQGNYDAALAHAEAALEEAPWLYEAATLAGDIYVERGEYARSQGSPKDEDRELANAVNSYEKAAAIGQSDAEVYENLAAAWLPRIRTAAFMGQPLLPPYTAVLAASDKSVKAEPENIPGRLKKTQATAQWGLSAVAGAASTTAWVKECLSGAEEIFKLQPGHPVAIEYAAFCHLAVSQLAAARGEDQTPFLRQAIRLAEPLVQKDPSRFNASHDLSAMYATLAEQLDAHGDPAVKEAIEKGLEYAHKTAALDPEVTRPWNISLMLRYVQVRTATSDQEMQAVLSQVDSEFAKIMARNAHEAVAFQLRLAAYATAAFRAYLAGLDSQPRLQQALESLANLRKLAGPQPNAEQYALLADYVDGSVKVRVKEDPAQALLRIEEDRKRCSEVKGSDYICLAGAARAGWLESEWLAQRNKPAIFPLQRALQQALTAAQSPQDDPDAWQILAETYLRLSSSGERVGEANHHIADGLAAVQRILAHNPNHALGLAIKGALLLARAQNERNASLRQSIGGDAAQALQKALAFDPLLSHQYQKSLETARALAQPAER